MTQPSYTLSSSSALSDDFIMTSDVLVDVSGSSAIGVYNVNGQPQALYVRADGVLCQIAPTSGASQAGWATTTVGTTAGVTGVVAGIQKDGSIHAFYTDATNTWHLALSNGVWSAPQALPLLTGINVTVNNTTGELVAYGIDGANLALVLQGTNGTWAVTSMAASNSLSGLKPVLLLTDNTNDWVLAVPGVVASNGAMELYQGSITAVLSGPDPVAFPNPVQQVVLGYWANNSAMFLATDSENNLYSSAGGTTGVTLVSSGTVATAAAIVDMSNKLHVYTVSAQGTVSVLHQTGWNSTTGPVWAPMIPLDGGLQAVYTDSSIMDSAAFFAIDTESVLWHYVQDAATGLWNVGKAQTPGPQSYRVPQFRTALTVVDENGSPAGNVTISVTSFSPSAVTQGGLLYPIGPATPATFVTSPLGRVNLSTIASNLSSPALTVTCDGVTLAAGINPAGDLHNYLAGVTSSLNAGSSTQLLPFSGTTVQSANVDGGPLAPATQDPNNGLQLANTATAGIQQAFQVQVPGNTVGITANAGLVAFAVDMTDRTNPLFLPFRTQEEYEHYRATGLFALGSTDPGDWWSSVKGFAEDVWNGIKKAAISVTKFVIHVADKAADLVVQVYNEVKNIVGLVISGIEDLVSAVQGAFAWIGAEVDKLIDWLKMLFDWQDIMNTSKALQSALGQVFPYLQGVITNQAEPLVSGFFSKLETQVSNAFDTAIGKYSGNQQVGSLVTAGSSPYAPPATALPGGTGGMLLADFKNWEQSVHNSWLMEKIESFLGSEPSLATVSGLADDFNSLASAYDTVVTDFSNALTDFGNFFTTALSDPKQLGTVGVADLLKAAKEVALAVLAFLDGIIETLLKVLATAIGAAGTVVTAPLDIPFFTAMFDSITSIFGVSLPSFSVSGIFCTALAIPVTVLYKIANGADTQPFPGGVLPTSSVRPGAELGSTATVAIQYTAAAIASVWALMDTGLDCVPDCELMVFKILDLVAPSLVGIFTWPGGIPFQGIPLSTDEEIASFANWVIGFSPVAIGIGTMLAGAYKWSETSQVPRYIDPAGKILLTAFGAINLISGIVAASLGASGGSIASDIVGPLPVLGQFLRLNSFEDGSEGLTLAIKLVIDFFAGEGLAVAIAVS